MGLMMLFLLLLMPVKCALFTGALIATFLTYLAGINCFTDPIKDRSKRLGHGLAKSPGETSQSRTVPLAQFWCVGHNDLLSVFVSIVVVLLMGGVGVNRE